VGDVDVLAHALDVDHFAAEASGPALASCVGSLHPESHIAYFHAVKARCFRYSSKSASVRSKHL
jgi:hypothetical protein